MGGVDLARAGASLVGTVIDVSREAVPSLSWRGGEAESREEREEMDPFRALFSMREAGSNSWAESSSSRTGEHSRSAVSRSVTEESSESADSTETRVVNL